jgi:hypothetical protein
LETYFIVRAMAAESSENDFEVYSKFKESVCFGEKPMKYIHV